MMQFYYRTQKSSKLIHREVIRLVTPGTLLEPLHPDANYLLSIIRGPGTSLGMAWMDISTGDFQMGTSTLEDLEQDLARVNPAEVRCRRESPVGVITGPFPIHIFIKYFNNI